MPLNISKKKHYAILTLIFSVIIITLAALIIQFISSIVESVKITSTIANPHDLWVAAGPWGRIWNSLSTFTIQSNILVLVFFTMVLNNYLMRTKNKWANSYFSLAVTVYINITMIIFWVALFKPLLEVTNFQTTFGVLNFINTFLLHLITPVLSIAYYFLTTGNNKWTAKTTLRKGLPVTISYMFAYLGYALIKGSFVGQIKTIGNNLVVDYSYPYFFLNIKANLGAFFLYFIIILSLFLLLFVTYYFYNNWKYQKDYGEKITNKKELLKAILT